MHSSSTMSAMIFQRNPYQFMYTEIFVFDIKDNFIFKHFHEQKIAAIFKHIHHPYSTGNLAIVRNFVPRLKNVFKSIFFYLGLPHFLLKITFRSKPYWIGQTQHMCAIIYWLSDVERRIWLSQHVTKWKIYLITYSLFSWYLNCNIFMFTSILHKLYVLKIYIQ